MSRLPGQAFVPSFYRTPDGYMHGHDNIELPAVTNIDEAKADVEQRAKAVALLYDDRCQQYLHWKYLSVNNSTRVCYVEQKDSKDHIILGTVVVRKVRLA